VEALAAVVQPETIPAQMLVEPETHLLFRHLKAAMVEAARPLTLGLALAVAARLRSVEMGLKALLPEGTAAQAQHLLFPAAASLMLVAVAAALTRTEQPERVVLAAAAQEQLMRERLPQARLTPEAVVVVPDMALPAHLAQAAPASSSLNTKSLQPQRSLPLSPRRSG
jgi:hypothetical protein